MDKIKDINNYVSTEKLENKHLLTLSTYSTEEIFEILHSAKMLKKKLLAGERLNYLENKTVALIFAKNSTRTRVSFEMAISQLSGKSLFLSSNDLQLGRGETIHDTVKTLERYFINAIMIRTFKQSDVEDLAKYGTIPIINGLTDLSHPCQALCDILTVWEKFGTLKGLKLAFFGNGNNVANSLLAVCTKCGMEISIACPKGSEPNSQFMLDAKKYGKVVITQDPFSAAENADILYTDVFFSMGQEIFEEKRVQLMPYQVNDAIMAAAKKTAVFMHCLPAHRGEEVSAKVLDGPQSIVFDQAENRLHVQKAILYLLLKDQKAR
ncbi:MAG: ornithine carbamoyltransferase [Firmicutes bacterium]|nr:ornithine carbamoyltransferase [Bacillota bacterium]